MRKRFQWSTLVLVALSCLLVLAGCGGKQEATTSGNEAAASNGLEAIKQRGKLVIGVKYDTKLFGLKDPASGKVEGFDIDIAKAVAKHIFGDETKLELKEVTSKTRITLLQNGDIDAIIATMTISDERKKQVDFSDVYFNAGQSLLVKKGSPITGLESLTPDTKVLAVKGSTSAKISAKKRPKQRF